MVGQNIFSTIFNMASKTPKVCFFRSVYLLFTMTNFRTLTHGTSFYLLLIFLQDNGLTPLMLAARDNKHNIVEKLLELGAVVTDRDKVSTQFVSLDTLWSLIRHCFSKPFFNYTRSTSNYLFAILSALPYQMS